MLVATKIPAGKLMRDDIINLRTQLPPPLQHMHSTATEPISSAYELVDAGRWDLSVYLYLISFENPEVQIESIERVQISEVFPPTLAMAGPIPRGR